MAHVIKRVESAELLFNKAVKMGLHPSWVVPNGLFVITTKSGERYVNRGISSLNPDVSTSLALNKYLTRLILDRHNLPNIPYAQGKSMAHAQIFLAKHGKIIVKPKKGSGSRDIFIVSNSEELARLDIEGCILEKYIKGREMRYLLLNGEVIAVHESKYGESVQEDRALERISYPMSAWDKNEVAMSIEIARILDLSFLAVDYLIDQHGQHYVLEVNTCPGLKWFHAPSEGPSVDVAQLFLEAMLA